MSVFELISQTIFVRLCHNVAGAGAKETGDVAGRIPSPLLCYHTTRNPQVCETSGRDGDTSRISWRILSLAPDIYCRRDIRDAMNGHCLVSTKNTTHGGNSRRIREKIPGGDHIAYYLPRIVLAEEICQVVYPDGCRKLVRTCGKIQVKYGRPRTALGQVDRVTTSRCVCRAYSRRSLQRPVRKHNAPCV